MPIYDYECKKCGLIFDKMVSIGDNEKVECPVCGSIDTEKLLSLFASFNSSCGAGGGKFS